MNLREVERLRDCCITYMMRFVGGFYKWGGDDPSGFDCSGFILEGLKSVGIIERQADYSADSLLCMLRKFAVEAPYAGCLSFTLDAGGKAVHVEMCTNKYQTVGASGGGSSTLTVANAIQQNAFIKVRLARGNIYVDPFKKLLT